MRRGGDERQDERRIRDGRRDAGHGTRETGDGRRETGDGRRETGDGRRETGDGRRETGDGRVCTMAVFGCCGKLCSRLDERPIIRSLVLY